MSCLTRYEGKKHGPAPRRRGVLTMSYFIEPREVSRVSHLRPKAHGRRSVGQVAARGPNPPTAVGGLALERKRLGQFSVGSGGIKPGVSPQIFRMRRIS